jgi:hypothetical protein
MEFQNVSAEKDAVAKHFDPSQGNQVWNDAVRAAYQSTLSDGNSAFRTAAVQVDANLSGMEIPPIAANKPEEPAQKPAGGSDVWTAGQNVLFKGLDGLISGAAGSSLSTPVEGMTRSEVFMSDVIGKAPSQMSQVAAFEAAKPALRDGAMRGAFWTAGLTLLDESLDSKFGDGSAHSIFKPSLAEAVLEGVAASLPEGRFLAVGGAWLAGRAYNAALSAIEKENK